MTDVTSKVAATARANRLRHIEQSYGSIANWSVPRLERWYRTTVKAVLNAIGQSRPPVLTLSAREGGVTKPRVSLVICTPRGASRSRSRHQYHASSTRCSAVAKVLLGSQC